MGDNAVLNAQRRTRSWLWAELCSCCRPERPAHEGLWTFDLGNRASYAAAREASLEIGLLRGERALHRPADVRAALADPMLPGDIERILRRAAA